MSNRYGALCTPKPKYNHKLSFSFGLVEKILILLLPKHRIIMASWFPSVHRNCTCVCVLAVDTERICGCPLIVNDQPITEYISSQNSSAPHRHLESIVHISTTTADPVYLLRTGINDVAPTIKCTPVQGTD